MINTIYLFWECENLDLKTNDVFNPTYIDRGSTNLAMRTANYVTNYFYVLDLMRFFPKRDGC
jgi:hypothetical protein